MSEQAPRIIVTSYYTHENNRDPIKVCRASHLEEAVGRCVTKMYRNDYAARYAAITNSDTGQIYAMYSYRPGEGFNVILDPKVDGTQCVMNPKDES